MLVIRGSSEIVDIVVLVVDGPEVVVCAVVGKNEVGNIVVTGDELNDSVGVVAGVIAGDVGLFLMAISKTGYQYCLEITSDPFLKVLISVRLATGQYSSALLFTWALLLALWSAERL